MWARHLRRLLCQVLAEQASVDVRGTAGFRTETAVALSNITIVGGAISNFLFNVGRRHEYFDKPLIDWELILVMEPTTILGALIGGYLNKVSLHPVLT